MHTLCKNIYKIARKSAGLTQIQAAEAINISVRSLADYENGKTVPPDDVVTTMVEVYGTPWLVYQHLKENTELGRKYLPEIDLPDLARAVLRFQKEVGDLEDVNKDLVEIACDGQISEHEKPTWQKITKEIKEVVGAAFSILFSAGEDKKEKALERAS